ncbi:unnamed protein product [Thlaspi arvense]|uniref:Uncharacterized protein n=1 Tax=Thlaspi arvense TaxID=13288 RepID=A0AAU9SDL1_THLAR|nr:unnamed protein product [Thlaspi arvense]
MGCCLSKKSSPSPPSILLSNGVKSPDPKSPIKPVIELPEKNPSREEAKPKSENLHQEEENGTTMEVLVIKHRRSHERTKKTDSEEDAPASTAAEKPMDSNSNSNSAVVRTSSCTKEEVDAILIQCGKLSQSNSAAKTRRYSGSKRSFDFDQNERIRGGGEVEEEEMVEKKTPSRNRHRGVERMNGSPRERRRRTPSREREDSKSYRSGSRERGNGGGGGGSRRVSRSPGKRSEVTNPNSCGGSGISVISSNIRPGKFVKVPATDKSNNNNGEPSIKRITVKRNIGEACRIAASPARTAASNVQPPPPPPQPSLSQSSSRKAEQSPYRRNPLGEIDQNSTKGDNCNKKMIKRENESANQKNAKPQVISRSRSLRKSRDFDFSQESLLQPNEEEKNTTSNYTALLLKDIKNFHGKSNNADDDDVDPSVSFNLLPSCVTKACSIVEAVADLNSTTAINASLSSDSRQFRFTSTAKKADLMEPSFEKYVTVKRGGSLEEQESCGSNNLT